MIDSITGARIPTEGATVSREERSKGNFSNKIASDVEGLFASETIYWGLNGNSKMALKNEIKRAFVIFLVALFCDPAFRPQDLGRGGRSCSKQP